ncbi:hypothetical protein CEUSTIGMA_g5571.t1 [Chlamydomonas eustigma]|uniref:Calcium-transporting ATPase n=1 Tax=Chlamydomonas eustigma TaxID=1157962 RepID=A0A250X5D3_9CHLO|nr:hypothetical protein CEUSTIGMA_g5571.t1 [Chlamydomonas eustigma]|eukprot:GAX78129.1 hypothetical protein CEUSTIGMA_g5571.t1 [Chlamydomonas eustigma]
MPKQNHSDEETGHIPRPEAFGIDQAALSTLNSEKDMPGLEKLGGVLGLANILGCDTNVGLNPSSSDSGYLTSRQEYYGVNRLPEAKPASFWMLMHENLQDPIILLLIAAATVSTGLGAGIPEQRAKSEWIEGVAIWVAVFLVSGVGAANDYEKDKQFRKLNVVKDSVQIKTLRDGRMTTIENHDLVVGDVVILDTGDKVVADCLLFETHGLVIDEASLTGESDAIKKSLDQDPWIRSGTQVTEGSGKALIVAVGENSEWGKTMALMEEAGEDETPLQAKLEVVAGAIGKVGFGVAIVCFIALMIEWLVKNQGNYAANVNQNGPIAFFLYGVTIIVVAVPEGLPLAVTISLAYSMKKMLIDQNFVRVLAACETMGGATAICSDKTGTLTENRMTVVEGWFAGERRSSVPGVKELPPGLLNELTMNIAMNSKAFLTDTLSGRVGYVGSSTECALLLQLRSWGVEYTEFRARHDKDVVQLHGFNSARKMSSVVMNMGSHYRLYNKGAAEWVLKRCTHAMDPSGGVQEMTSMLAESLTGVVADMARRGLRCICLTYKDYNNQEASRWAFERPIDFFGDPDKTDQNLVVMAIVGIKDPVREEVPGAVATCKGAGITVRMVTGDNIHTAIHIARECGILTHDDQIALEGPVFRQMYEEQLLELQELLPNLRVLARSSPEDKLTLVKLLKQAGEVVAVTGDGTNDAPALKESDVGLAMGIAGTEVAKEAADIIILDDNFSSIVKTVLWGRSVFNNIRKFLQFQLTVNCAALIICFIGAVAGGKEPLNVLQLLWVNLIMDTMGALALATEAPSMELLDQPPNGHGVALISNCMWKHIVVQGLYQVTIMLICLYVLPVRVPRYAISSQSSYYAQNCVYNVEANLGLQASDGSYNNGHPDATWFCLVMNNCGFPLHAYMANTMYCPLHINGTSVVPTRQVDAVCFNNAANLGQDCSVNDQLNSAINYMNNQLTNQQNSDWEPVLSLLFNAFIWCQVFNEICSRRINDEYDFFSGLHKSPIFLTVLLITIGLQALIINFMGIFFTVVPLSWLEWLVCIAVGVVGKFEEVAYKCNTKLFFD